MALERYITKKKTYKYMRDKLKSGESSRRRASTLRSARFVDKARDIRVLRRCGLTAHTKNRIYSRGARLGAKAVYKDLGYGHGAPFADLMGSRLSFDILFQFLQSRRRDLWFLFSPRFIVF